MTAADFDASGPLAPTPEQLALGEVRAVELGRVLGLACERALLRPRLRRCLRMRLAAGAEPDDALIAVLARRARRDGAVAGELLRELMPELVQYGCSILPPQMRRLHDPDDLVASVLGDCFQEVFSSSVEGRSHLVALLEKRIRWKSIDRGRSMFSQKRREDLRSEALSKSMDDWSAGPSPIAQAAAREELQQLARRLRRLSGRDRKILSLHFAQHSLIEIAERVGMTASGAGRAVQRLLSGGGCGR